MSINRTDPVTVADLVALSLIHVAELIEGAQCWVTSQEGLTTDDGQPLSALFVLEKASGATADADTIAPLNGSPIAGNADARWVRFPPRPAPLPLPFFLTYIYAQVGDGDNPPADTNSSTPTRLVGLTAPATPVNVSAKVVCTWAFGYDIAIESKLLLFIDGADQVPPYSVPVLVSGDSNASAAPTVQPGCIDFINFNLSEPGVHVFELFWATVTEGGLSIHCHPEVLDSRQLATMSVVLAPA